MTGTQDLKSLAVQVAELLEHLRRQGEAIGEANLATARRLDQAASAVPGAMQLAVQDAIEPVAQHIARQVGGQLVEPLDRLQRQVLDIHDRLAGDVETQQRITTRLQATARWAAVIAVVMAVAMAALLSAFTWQARQARAEAARYTMDASWARMLGEADMVPCEGRVCVRVDGAAHRAQGDDGYVAVRQRDAAATP